MIAGVAADVGEDVAVVVVVGIAVRRAAVVGERQGEGGIRPGARALEPAGDVQPKPQRERHAVGGIQVSLHILLGRYGGGEQERAGDRHRPIFTGSIHDLDLV